MNIDAIVKALKSIESYMERDDCKDEAVQKIQSLMTYLGSLGTDEYIEFLEQDNYRLREEIKRLKEYEDIAVSLRKLTKFIASK